MSVCPQVWLDGQFLAPEAAKISIFDRGFLFSHAAYEVSAVVGGKIVDPAPHMARLERTLAGLEIPMPMSSDALLDLHRQMIDRNEIDEGLIYLNVSGGAYGERDFYGPEVFIPSVMMFAMRKSLITDKQADGVAAISAEDLRWARRDYKTTQLLHQTQVYRAARAAGATTAFMHEDGVVTEAASANAFIVTAEGRLVTRPLGHDILPGITRQSLFGLLGQHNIALEERPFTLDEVRSAAEAFTSSTGAAILPVVRFEGQPIGSGKPGPVTRKLQYIYFGYAGFDVAARAPWCCPD